MSPELIDPQRFGFKNSRPTKSSDCYALGMVIYETISGNLPFPEHANLTVFVKVLAGERPPRKVRFVGGLWELVEQCWAPQPNDRPSIKDVLHRLEMVPNLSEPHSPGVDEEVEEDYDDWDLISSSCHSDLPNGASGTMRTEGGMATSSSVSDFTDLPPGFVPTVQEKYSQAVIEIAESYQESGSGVWDKMNSTSASFQDEANSPGNPQNLVSHLTIAMHCTRILNDQFKHPVPTPPKGTPSSPSPGLTLHRRAPTPLLTVSASADQSTPQHLPPKSPNQDQQLARLIATKDSRPPGPQSSHGLTLEKHKKQNNDRERSLPQPITAANRLHKTTNAGGGTTPKKREEEKGKAEDDDITRRLQKICIDAYPTQLYRNLVKIGTE
jgi:hypothetical protein